MNFNDNVKGKLPSDIGKLSLLNRIAFSQNQLTGPIPDSICDAVFLEQIYMRYNSLSGRIPSCIGSLKSLEILQVRVIGSHLDFWSCAMLVFTRYRIPIFRLGSLMLFVLLFTLLAGQQPSHWTRTGIHCRTEQH